MGCVRSPGACCHNDLLYDLDIGTQLMKQSRDISARHRLYVNCRDGIVPDNVFPVLCGKRDGSTHLRDGRESEWSQDKFVDLGTGDLNDGALPVAFCEQCIDIMQVVEVVR
jgi:hypothetical protein